jgi:hypothetical protein
MPPVAKELCNASEQVEKLARIIFPYSAKERWMFMFTAYLDESGTHAGAGILAVAGYVSVDRQWVEFQREWQEILIAENIPFFHMADYESRFGIYKDWSNEKRIRVITRLCSIIKRRVHRAFTSSVILSDYNEVAAMRPDLFGTPYGFNANICMRLISDWAEQRAHKGPIAYVFERGSGYEAELAQQFNIYLSSDELKALYRLSTLTFADKRDILPLQAADILVYEVRKRALNQTDDSKKKFVRRSMNNIGGVPGGYHYWTKQNLLDLIASHEEMKKDKV